MKRIYVSVLTILLFAQCSSTRMIPDQNNFTNNLNKINYLGSSNESKVFLRDSNSINCYYLNISKDSLSFTNVENDSTYHISIDQLSKIIIKDNTASLMGGLWIGLVSSSLAILISTMNECKTCHPNTGPLIVGTVAAIVGYIYGYNYTGEKEFLFNEYFQE